jgi:hypothetical protein
MTAASKRGREGALHTLSFGCAIPRLCKFLANLVAQEVEFSPNQVLEEAALQAGAVVSGLVADSHVFHVKPVDHVRTTIHRDLDSDLLVIKTTCEQWNSGSG